VSAWSQRWRDLLIDAAPQIARRVTQGRQLLRSGRVTDVRVSAGMLSGRVQGSRATPHLVEIDVGVLPDDAWGRVVGVLAGQVRHSARLLAGLVPDGFDAELEGAGVDLFPDVGGLDVTCLCRDPVSLCAHAAAVWEAVAALLEADPFVLLRLRGRGRDRLLAELAAARRSGAADGAAAGVPLDRLDPEGWTRARAPLDDLHLPAAGPSRSAAPLRVLGDPPGWAGGVSALDLFGPLVERAAAHAERAAAHAERLQP
jgi:uncharacterized Zn finger protein